MPTATVRRIENPDPFTRRDRLAAALAAAEAKSVRDLPTGEGDAALIQAERDLDRLESEIDRRARDPEQNDELLTPLFDATVPLDNRIALTPPATLAGAAVKLRQAIHMLSIDLERFDDRNLVSLCQVFALIERMAAAPDARPCDGAA